MILRSAICFRIVRFLALLGTSLSGCLLHATDVTGSISITGSHGESRHDESGVVVWLSREGEPVEPAPIRSRMIQKNKTFSPHVLAIPVGSIVDLPNLDPIFHNAFSNFNGQVFDVGLYPPGKSRPVRFRQAGVVRVFCNIHPAMSAVIVVLDTPYFAVSNTSGRYRIENVPDGKYQVHLFHERATPDELAALGSTTIVSSQNSTIAPIRISEAGYIPAPHTNKFGRQYPPDAEQDGYSSRQ